MKMEEVLATKKEIFMDDKFFDELKKLHSNLIVTTIRKCISTDSSICINCNKKEIEVNVNGKTVEILFLITIVLDSILNRELENSSSNESKLADNTDDMVTRIESLHDYLNLIEDLYIGFKGFQSATNICKNNNIESLEVLIKAMEMRRNNPDELKDIFDKVMKDSSKKE